MISDFFTYIPKITLSSPSPIAFYLGVWSVRWYGIFIAASFLVAYFLAEKLIIKNKLDLNYFNDLVFLVLLFSIIFARLWFVFLSWDYFKEHSSDIPKIWHGGQSIHGGIFGAVFAIFLYTKIKKISFFNYADITVIVAPLAQAIGRWGNFFNNEAFGLPITENSSFPLRLFIPQEFRPEKYLTFEYFHPTFLYESFFNFIIFIFLYKNYSVWRLQRGKTFWIYLLSYSIVRFFLEFLRVDSLYLFGNIASAHIVSVILCILAIIFLLKR